MRYFVICFCLLFTSLHSEPLYPFANDEQAVRYQQLLKNLRCVMCQNQSLLESNAPIAQQLREVIYQQINENNSDEAIQAFLVKRYGDFILLAPPFNQATWILWLSPFVLLLIALVVGFYYWRRLLKAAVPVGE